MGSFRWNLNKSNCFFPYYFPIIFLFFHPTQPMSFANHFACLCHGQQVNWLNRQGRSLTWEESAGSVVSTTFSFSFSLHSCCQSADHHLLGSSDLPGFFGKQKVDEDALEMLGTLPDDRAMVGVPKVGPHHPRPSGYPGQSPWCASACPAHSARCFSWDLT